MALDTTISHAETANSSPKTGLTFNPKVMIIMIIIGIFSFGSFVTVSGFSDELRDGDNGRAHALSKSPNGFAGIVQLLGAQGYETEILRDEHRKKVSIWQQQDDALRVYTFANAYSGKILEDMDIDHPTLIVMPKWNTRQASADTNDILKSSIIAPSSLSSLVSELDEDLVFTQAENPKVTLDSEVELDAETDEDDAERDISNVLKRQNEYIQDIHIRYKRNANASNTPFTAQTYLVNDMDRLQGFKSSNVETVLSATVNGEEKTILGLIDDTQVYILSDPDLLNNAGIKSLTTAQLATAILTYANPNNSPIGFDVTLHGLGTSENLIKVLMRPPFLAATLCALAVAFLIGWRAFSRFGRPQIAAPSYALGKQALADNSAGLIRLAGREANMGPRYAAMIKSDVARAVNLPKTLNEAAISEALERMSTLSNSGQKFSLLYQQSQRVTDTNRMLRLAQSLHKWRQEILHDRN